MKITNACEQYFNACQELGNWKNNDNWTNAGLAIQVLSYFTIIAPVIVLATYATVTLSGRITQIDKPSGLDSKIGFAFQNNTKKQYFHMRVSSLKELSKLNPTEQKEALQGFDFENLNKFIDTLGGVDNFLEMLSKADPNILALVPLMEVEGDPILFKYASLSEDEVRALPLKELSPLTSNNHVQILKAQIDKLPKIDHDNLLPLDDLSCLTLGAFNSHIFTKDQISELITSFGEIAINFIPEEQIKDFIINNEKMNNISKELYKALFTCLDVDANKMRFSCLPHGRVKEIMLKFNGSPVNLLSKEQAQHFFANLKSTDVDQTLYNNLFPYYDTVTSRARFQLIPKEEAANFMLTFKGAPVDLLSKEQAKHFFANLKSTGVDHILYNKLFPSHDTVTSRARFQLIPKEEAANFMLKFKGAPVDLLSKEQAKHFFGNLKSTGVDHILYNKLFPSHDTATSRSRFQLIPKEEASNFMLKFKGAPVDLLSAEQAKHFFGNLKSTGVDHILYNKLFPSHDTVTSRSRFQLIPKEEASNFMLKFKGAPVDLLSKEQAKHFFANLKATDVNQTLYNKLFPSHDTVTSRSRFQLLSQDVQDVITTKFIRF